MATKHQHCHDCETGLDRRDFIRAVGGAALVTAAAPVLPAVAAPTPKDAAETAVTRFYKTLSDEQKKAICLPFDHKFRSHVDANWHITDVKIGDDSYTDEQRKLVDEIIRGVTSEDGYERLQKQMKADTRGRGVDAYSVAVFGEPGSGKFEWELTGRHLTLRADGDSVDNVAFGGPIVYGHGAGNPNRNVFHYQTKAANEVFKALDPAQADKALLSNAPAEDAVELQGGEGKFPGVAVGDLSGDQQELVEATLKTLLAPYRKADVDEAIAILKQGGGLETLHMAFYREGDLNDDKVWDIWRLEGPTLACHFRGAPHVHAYINIGVKS